MRPLAAAACVEQEDVVMRGVMRGFWAFIQRGDARWRVETMVVGLAAGALALAILGPEVQAASQRAW